MKLVQVTLSDLLDQHDVPIGPGDYVEHASRPGIPYLVVSKPYKTTLGQTGIHIKDCTDSTTYPVLLSNIKRC